MKKGLALLLVAALFLGGCGGKNEGKLKIGIIQLVQHDALDQAREGFIASLADSGYVDGDKIVIDYQNAQGEIPTTTTIANKLVNGKSDLILAIATPAAQSVANVTTTIPIVVTAVTDPADAGLVASNESPGGNVTGTSDLAPVKEQIELLHKIAPEAKTVGVLFNSGESNSRLQADMAIAAIEELGLTAMEFTVSQASEIQQVTQLACSKVDALYTPTDNMIAAGMPIVAATAIEHKIPHVGGEKGQVEGGALATIGLDYYQLGWLAGKQAVEILEGKDPGTIPIGYQTEFALDVNEETRAALGITLPADLV